MCVGSYFSSSSESEVLLRRKGLWKYEDLTWYRTGEGYPGQKKVLHALLSHLLEADKAHRSDTFFVQEQLM